MYPQNKTNMNDEFDHESHLGLYSEIYPTPSLYTTPTELPSQKPDAKQRRRRKRAKKESEINGKKRKLSEEQVKMLEMSFELEHKLETDRKDKLAAQLGMEPKQVAVWFQNRRARYRNKKLEVEFSKLRCQHDSLLLDKSLLQMEVLKLKEKLNESHQEIQRLSDEIMLKCNHNSPTTPSSSQTVTVDPVADAAHYSLFQLDDHQINLDASLYFQDHDVFNTIYQM